MDARTQIESQIAGAVVEAAKSTDNAMTMKDAKSVSEIVAAEVAPIVVNQTNQEPWYQSNVTMGALLIIITRLLAHYGYAIPQELHGPILDLIIAFGPYVGGAWVLFGRWIASKPLGEGPIISRIAFWRKRR